MCYSVRRKSQSTTATVFYPTSGHFRCPSACLKGANKRLMHAQLPALFNHLVGAAEQRKWDVEPERLGALQIKEQLDFCGQLHRQVARLFSLEDAPDIVASMV